MEELQKGTRSLHIESGGGRAACLGDIVHLGKLDGDAEADKEDRDVGSGAPEISRHHCRGLLLCDGCQLLERGADSPQWLVRIVGAHRLLRRLEIGSSSTLDGLRTTTQRSWGTAGLGQKKSDLESDGSFPML
jgi:hypothetical protein